MNQNNLIRLKQLVKTIPIGGIVFVSHRFIYKAYEETPPGFYWGWYTDKWAQHGLGHGIINERTIATIGKGCGYYGPHFHKG